MQEYTIKYEGFRQGLRPTNKGRRQTPALIEAFNVRSWRGTFQAVQPIIQPTVLTVDFPFPQLAIGQKTYQLDHSAVRILSSQFQPIQTAQCISGGSWHWADFGQFVLFANGETVMQDHPIDGLSQWTGPQFSTCCNYHGQLFVGGFFEPWHDAGMNSVGWSKIGSAEMLLDKSNVSGYTHLTIGDCLRVAVLGNGVIAYGNQGVDYFKPVSQPVVGWAKQFLSIIPGIAGRSAVAGNDAQQLLVDSTGQLWMITGELQPQLLGYEEFFQPMLGNDIVVTHNQRDNSFSISDGYSSFTYCDGGLTRQFQAITSQQVYLGGSIGFFESIDDHGFELKTDTMDFGFRGLKTLTSIEIAYTSPLPLFASCEWRSDPKASFRANRWVRVNERGIATLMVTASEFRLKLQNGSYEGLELDYILVKYKSGDRRNIRGGRADAGQINE